MPLIWPCMGIKLFTSHSSTPITKSVMTTVTSGISSSPITFLETGPRSGLYLSSPWQPKWAGSIRRTHVRWPALAQGPGEEEKLHSSSCLFFQSNEQITELKRTRPSRLVEGARPKSAPLQQASSLLLSIGVPALRFCVFGLLGGSGATRRCFGCGS